MKGIAPRAEHFAHGADVGVRGIGPSRETAFEQAAVALSEIVTELQKIEPKISISVECQAPSDALLLVDWLNAVIYRMAVERMLFRRFAVTIFDHRLRGEAWGEAVDRDRHAPAVEPKGATYTELRVERDGNGEWIAQCVVDV
ncbi:MAG TPA: archease [Stellaceae bacterium]|nr:archease [Stellaceae bacterium]